jgi:hypothetical protein
MEKVHSTETGHIGAGGKTILPADIHLATKSHAAG